MKLSDITAFINPDMKNIKDATKLSYRIFLKFQSFRLLHSIFSAFAVTIFIFVTVLFLGIFLIYLMGFDKIDIIGLL